MSSFLVEIENRLGPPPRNIGLWNWFTYVKIRRPTWLYEFPDDQIQVLLDHQDVLFQEGVIVWGKLLQANRQLFGHGPNDHPGDLLFSPNPGGYTSVEDLDPIAQRVKQLKGTSPSDPELKTIADHLTDERVRVYGLRVPASISPRIPCMISTTYFARKHLPGGKLSSGFFPVIVLPRPPHVALPVPSKYWPQELINCWIR